jgi:hypothetical protein
VASAELAELAAWGVLAVPEGSEGSEALVEWAARAVPAVSAEPVA